MIGIICAMSIETEKLVAAIEYATVEAVGRLMSIAFESSARVLAMPFLTQLYAVSSVDVMASLSRTHYVKTVTKMQYITFGRQCKTPRRFFMRNPTPGNAAGGDAGTLSPVAAGQGAGPPVRGQRNMYLRTNSTERMMRKAFTRSRWPQSRLTTVQNMNPKNIPSAML